MMLAFGPSWRSSGSAPNRCHTRAAWTFHVLEDVSGEIDIFEDPKVLPAIPASPLSEDVSGETLTFIKRALEAAFSTSHFFEDVSGESSIFEDPEIRPAISTSPFCEDVSGEIVICNIKCLKR